MRFELQPVWDACPELDVSVDARQRPNRFAVLAARAGLSERSLQRYASEGVPLLGVERLAHGLGRHPCELWPEYHYEVLAQPLRHAS